MIDSLPLSLSYILSCLVCGETMTTITIKKSKCSLFISYICNDGGFKSNNKEILKYLSVTCVYNLTC